MITNLEKAAALALEALEEYEKYYGRNANQAFAMVTLRGALLEQKNNIEAAVLAEREACAKVCDAIQKKHEDEGAWLWEAKNCAAAIRARGE